VTRTDRVLAGLAVGAGVVFFTAVFALARWVLGAH
jgi:hypothetical protein